MNQLSGGMVQLTMFPAAERAGLGQAPPSGYPGTFQKWHSRRRGKHPRGKARCERYEVLWVPCGGCEVEGSQYLLEVSKVVGGQRETASHEMEEIQVTFEFHNVAERLQAVQDIFLGGMGG